MADQKLENLLNISLDVDEEQREKSPNLNSGYNVEDKTWELIVKYQGDINILEQKYPNTKINVLLNNYAIINTLEENIVSISNEDVIQFVEKPKRLFFELEASKSESCINLVQQGMNNPFKLFGDGVIVAVIDTGIDALNNEFRNEDGTTRILNIYDQDNNEEWDKNRINYELKKNSLDISFIGKDFVGHGTSVATIACGNSGVASKSDIIIVKLGIGVRDGFPRTTQLMDGINYVVKKAIEYRKPIAINISFGNNYGNHVGSSLLESFIDDISFSWKNAICVGTGNEGDGATHYGGNLINNQESVVEFVVSDFETSINLQIWKNYEDEFDVEVIAPGNRNLGIISDFNTVNTVNVLGTTVLTYRAEPTPYSVSQEIYIDIIPEADNNFILSGVWKIRLIPKKIVDGGYDIWLPAIQALNIGTGFLRPDGSLSITIPATAENAISVGAYDARTNTLPSFSGKGYVKRTGGYVTSKPDIVAPGVEIMIGTAKTVTGTSFATPFVTGGCALLMEWGIVRGNDEYLYGEKLKAYITKGARRLPGFNDYPNAQVGWGELCVRDSIPV